MTVVVGANSSGKSALIDPIGVVSTGRSRSLSTNPGPLLSKDHDGKDTKTRLTIVIRVGADDIDGADSQKPLEALRLLRVSSLLLRLHLTESSNALQLERVTVASQMASAEDRLLDGNTLRTLVIQKLREDEAGLHTTDAGHAGSDFWLHRLTDRLVRSIMLIGSHRPVQATSPLGDTDTIGPGGASLAAYLHTRQTERDPRIAELDRFLNLAFPEYRRLNFKMVGNQLVRILVEGAGLPSDGIPLDAVGTGVQQVVLLASLIILERGPRTFFVDEPHAFLHPGAERALMDLIRTHPQHQYVLVTHSPTLINAVPLAAIRSIQFVEGIRTVRSMADEEIKDAEFTMRMVESLGLRQEDLFQAPAVILVEGDSDGPILRRLLERCGGTCRHVRFVPIAGTGLLKAAGARRDFWRLVLNIVKSLAIGRAQVVVLQDGDMATPDASAGGDLAESRRLVEKQWPGGWRYLKSRQLESFLLDRETVHGVIRGLLAERGVEPIESEISGAFDSAEWGSDAALRDPSRCLIKLFQAAKLTYDKLEDGLRIAEALPQVPDCVRAELVDVLKAIDGVQLPSPATSK